MIKYIKVRVDLYIVSSLIIQPICVIDEYAMIDRSLDWFIPINPPITAFATAKIARIFWLFLYKIKDNTVNGASFCHVDKIRHETHEVDAITEGYHR